MVDATQYSRYGNPQNHLHACSYFTRPFTWRKPKQEAPDPEIILKSAFHHEPKLPDAPPPENKK